MRTCDAVGLMSMKWANYFQFSKDGNMRDEATSELTGYNISTLMQSPYHGAFQQKIKEYRHANRQAPTKDCVFGVG